MKYILHVASLALLADAVCTTSLDPRRAQGTSSVERTKREGAVWRYAAALLSLFHVHQLTDILILTQTSPTLAPTQAQVPTPIPTTKATTNPPDQQPTKTPN